MIPINNPKPRIAITIGDPGGIGSEIALKALADPALADIAEWLLIADLAPLVAAAQTSGIDPASLPVTLVETENLDPTAPFVFENSPRNTAWPRSTTSGAPLRCVSRAKPTP